MAIRLRNPSPVHPVSVETTRTTLILLTSAAGALRQALLACFAGVHCDLRVIDDLERAFDGLSGPYVLLSFGTSVIVPQGLISRCNGRAYNLHAASPFYPGRDPHHFAIYEEAARYGATLHVMTARVDDGPIIDVEWFDVPPDCRPGQLLDLANAAALRVLSRRIHDLISPTPPRGDPDLRWSGPKRTRADFRAMCHLATTISPQEFQRRFRAFDGEGHDNLTTELHGQHFRIEKPKF
jgi:methionyl-tRNA formyltransferase